MVLFAGPDGALDPSAVPVTVLEGGEAEFGIEGAGKMFAVTVAATVGDGGEVEVRVFEELQCLELVPLIDEGIEACAGEDLDGSAQVAAGDVKGCGDVFGPHLGVIVEEGDHGIDDGIAGGVVAGAQK